MVMKSHIVLSRNRKKLWFLMIAFTASICITIVAKLAFYLQPKNANTYYSTNIFYISLSMNNELYNNDHLNITVKCINGDKSTNINANRFKYIGGAKSHLYYVESEKEYNYCSFSIQDDTGVKWLNATYLTKIQNFNCYNINLLGGGTYDYNTTKWIEPTMTTKQFCDVFIGQHVSDLINPFFGQNAYKNLELSFKKIIGNKKELLEIPKVGSVQGNNAFEQLESIKEEYEKYSKGI